MPAPSNLEGPKSSTAAGSHARRSPSLEPRSRRRLPTEASPAKVAKDSQHNNDDDDDPKPGRHVSLSLGASRFYGDPCLKSKDRSLGKVSYRSAPTYT